MELFKKICRIMLYPFELLCLFLIYVYKWLISPLLPHTCKFTPTCSTYAVNALKEFGVMKGGWLAFKRICRCTPFCKAKGYDPIPSNLKGDLKWLL